MWSITPDSVPDSMCWCVLRRVVSIWRSGHIDRMPAFSICASGASPRRLLRSPRSTRFVAGLFAMTDSARKAAAEPSALPVEFGRPGMWVL